VGETQWETHSGKDGEGGGGRHSGRDGEGDSNSIGQGWVMHESRHLESSTNESKVQRGTIPHIAQQEGTTAHSVLTSHNTPVRHRWST
jgi:hypothetical protein